jgi:hypothetical protein
VDIDPLESGETLFHRGDDGQGRLDLLGPDPED